MNLPDEGIAFIKSNYNINVRLEPTRSNNPIGIKKFGECLIYDKKIINENLIWLSFIELNIRKYIHIKNEDISIAPIKNGIYLIESLFNENKFLGINKNSTSGNLHLFDEDQQFSAQLFYICFLPIDECYYIQLFNSNKFLSVNEDNFQIKLVDNRKNDLQKWKIKIIDSYSNIFQIENSFFNLNISLHQNENKFILEKQNNSKSQNFYLWEEYNKNIIYATLPNKQITKKMVKRKKYLQYVIIDNSIKKIEEEAFANCFFLEKIKCRIKWLKYFKFINNNIQNIKIIEGDETIKKSDFLGFENITDITLPKSIKFIEEDTFSDFTNLINVNCDLKWYKFFRINSIEIPNGETKLKKEIFYNAKNIKFVNIPKTINEIEESAFENCGIVQLDIPEGVQVIPKNAFKNCKNLIKLKLPKTVINIGKSAFLNCPKLTVENIIILNKNFNGLIKKELVISSEIKSIYDYLKYIGIEDITISLNSKFKSEKEAKEFFSQFKYIIKGCFSPEYFDYVEFENLLYYKIPEGIYNIPPNTFNNCKNLEYLEIPNTVNPKILPESIFYPLVKLKEVKVPNSFYFYKDKLFIKCIHLIKIRFENGHVEKFKLIYEINNKIKNVKIDDLIKIKNLGTLIIPESVESIEPSIYDLSENLECVECHPKWLKYLPIYQLKKVIIPKFADIIDEKLFIGGGQINEIIFKGDSLLMGNSCKDFENIQNFKCYPSIGINPNHKLKKSEKIIHINDTEKIDSKSFKGWIGIKNVFFPNNLKYIEEEAFCDCINLVEIEIPKSVIFIHETSFKNCIKLRKIIANVKFLKIFPSNNVKEIILNEGSKEINPQVLKNFKKLETLEIPENIKSFPANLISNLQRFYKIKCCSDLLENLSNDDKERIQEIELIDRNKKISKNLLKQFNNVQDVRFHQNNDEINPLNYSPHETNVDDIIKFDKNNIIYKKYLENILNDIKIGRITNYDNNDFIGKISQNISDICIEIKKFTNGKMSPHPVQCFSILRLVHELFTNKGTLAEISTGEGKSYIISVVSIILVRFGRIVDIVTTNLELAFRDEQEQKDYYQLFNIKSGVLCTVNGDEEYIGLYKPEYNKFKPHSCGFYTHVLDYPIIYSANFNYQFLHLYSFGKKEIIRKRKYDIVIIDEVDNMLIDQMSTPSIIGYEFNFYKFKQILKEIFCERCQNERK